MLNNLIEWQSITTRIVDEINQASANYMTTIARYQKFRIESTQDRLFNQLSDVNILINQLMIYQIILIKLIHVCQHL